MFRIETQHAFRVLAAIARHEERQVLGVLAEEAQVPGPMLAKVLNRLSRHGIVSGRPGPGGGYGLARPAADTRLLDVVRVTEGPGFGLACLFGLPSCSDESQCPLHEVWGGIRAAMMEVLERHSIRDLSEERIDWPLSLSRTGSGDSRHPRRGARAGAAARAGTRAGKRPAARAGTGPR